MEYSTPIILGVVTLSLAILASRFWLLLRALRQRYAGVTRIQDEIDALKANRDRSQKELQEFEATLQLRNADLLTEYKKLAAQRDELKKEVSLLEENLEDISFGLYKPHFSFQSSEEYKAALEDVREQERRLIRDGKASFCPLQWTVGNSEKEGTRMTKQYTKLLLRGFNGECDAAVANVSWNNIERMEERVRKSFESLNQLGSTMKMSLTQEYMKLKLAELRMTYECEEKKREEREEQRRIREQIRDEERAQQEIEKARQQAEKEEADYEKALSKARDEALKATGSQLDKLTKQISSFETKLDEARQNKQRALARAQLTKSGFVYVISNIGSFGDRVFKIGMTRRLEPMDRIDELGDASVPFAFDLHAMLYSDNAPELESALHRLVQDRQVNLVNVRKEFYKDVELSEIEAFVKQRGLSAQFNRIPEAKEYRETLAIRAQRSAALENIQRSRGNGAAAVPEVAAQESVSV
jgi:DNA repair exonuclease SbcCD ATPase subunit